MRRRNRTKSKEREKSHFIDICLDCTGMSKVFLFHLFLSLTQTLPYSSSSSLATLSVLHEAMRTLFPAVLKRSAIYFLRFPNQEIHIFTVPLLFSTFTICFSYINFHFFVLIFIKVYD